ncbi:hypothetical protein CF651_04105 [Paenibacillus rigui]|uniref:Uncharacterized protein n=1 Tax=Paenibacillus rigui TaxID=554312 RepID=A0A229UW41_9BACL|nr:hypothetical protein CF651_04105 [Paenibacillus rigui]
MGEKAGITISRPLCYMHQMMPHLVTSFYPQVEDSVVYLLLTPQAQGYALEEQKNVLKSPAEGKGKCQRSGAFAFETREITAAGIIQISRVQ